MRALIVYESMYGNTHVVANHIADGLRSQYEVDVVPVEGATPERVAAADLLVVGGPTHVARDVEREVAPSREGVDVAKSPQVRLDPDAEGEGLRDWFHGLAPVAEQGRGGVRHADRRASLLTGRASAGIEKRLTRIGYDLVADPESFLVDKQNHLLPGEAERVAQWAGDLAASLAANP